MQCQYRSVYCYIPMLSCSWCNSMGAIWKWKMNPILITKYSGPICIELRFTGLCQMSVSNMTESKGLIMTWWQASRPYVNKQRIASICKLILTFTSISWVYIIWLCLMLALSNSEHVMVLWGDFIKLQPVSVLTRYRIYLDIVFFLSLFIEIKVFLYCVYFSAQNFCATIMIFGSKICNHWRRIKKN